MVSLNTNRSFVGTWTLDKLSYAGLKASGSGKINLTSGLSGQLSASVPSVTSISAARLPSTGKSAPVSGRPESSA